MKMKVTEKIQVALGDDIFGTLTLTVEVSEHTKQMAQLVGIDEQALANRVQQQMVLFRKLLGED